MNITTSHVGSVVVLRLDEPRLTYPLLSDFASTATNLIGGGEKRIVVDISAIGYVDSAAIGCLMDLYRQATAAGGTLKLAGVQKRVETMLAMTGAHNFLEVHGLAMRAITTISGSRIELDGDVLAVLETISRDLARRQVLDYGFEDVDREIQHVIGQLTDEELRIYLKESLFMSFNRYENDRMLKIVARASKRSGKT
jgi:anti-anti-sigma factor